MSKDDKDEAIKRVDGGFQIVLPDGSVQFIGENELYVDDVSSTNKSKFRLRDIKQKVVSLKVDILLPQPVRAILFLKTEEDRRNYIKSLPQYSVNAMVSWFTYVILKGQILEKCIDLGITIPADVSAFFKRIESEVQNAGKLTKEVVSKAVGATVTFGISVAVISFGILIIMNPALLPVIITVTSVAEFAYWFSKTWSASDYNKKTE
ncbi:hypothetical protein ACVWZB_004733 [Paenibacillus polymyxa]